MCTPDEPVPPAQGRGPGPPQPEAEDRFRALADAIPHLVWTAGPDGGIGFCNRRALEFSGLTAEEVQGSGWVTSIHPEDRERVLGIWQEAVCRGAEYRTEFRIRRQDGAWIWHTVHALARRAEDGAIVEWLGTCTDIHERRAAVEDLSRSEERLRLAQQAGRVGIFDADVRGRCTVWSEVLYALYGLDPAAMPNPFDRWLERVHPEDRAAVERRLARAVARGAPEVALEHRIVRPDGQERWLATHTSIAYDGSGHPVRMVGTSQDVTERRQAEEQIRSLARFPEENPNPVLRAAPDGVVLYANRPAWGMLRAAGWRRADLLPEPLRAAVAGALSAGGPQEVRFTVPDGRVWSVVLAGHADRREVNLYARDTTRREAAEQALRDTASRLARAQELAHLGSWELDVPGNRLTWSDEVYRIFGLQPQEFDATYEAFLEHVHPEDRARVDEAYRGSIREGRDAYDIEHRVVRGRSGEVRWVQERCQHVRDAEGRIVRSLGMVLDITLRRQAEETLRRHNAVLVGINRILDHGMQAPSDEALGKVCLRVAEAVTGSRLGFIAEVGPDGNLHDLAISRGGWDACVLPGGAGHRQRIGSFPVRGIYGRVVLHGRGLIANDPAAHPDRAGLPAGHPPVANFLGVPMLQEGRVVGMIAVGNREGGYCPEEQQALEALAPAVVEALARKRAENAFRESEVRFRAMADGTPLSIWVTDPEGRIAFVNRAYRDFFGVTEEAVRTGGWQSLVHLNDTVSYVEEFTACLREQRPFHARGRVRRHDGEWRWVESYGQPRFSPSGEFLGMAGSSPDITERIQAEEALRRLNTELEERVRQRTALLEVRAEQLTHLASQLTLAEQRERRRLASLLHDHLQQLLVGANFGLEVLSRRIGPEPQGSLEQVRELVNESIQVSRSLTAELSPPILHEAGLSAGLSWLARWMRDKHGLEVELDLDRQADPRREDVRVLLFEATRELLLNVVKHAGVTRARVRLAPLAGEEVEVVVSDQGAGFDPAALPGAGPAGGGFGLFSIRERLALLGGRLEI
ncbi:MAG: PAS domain-containing protein, partial [Candidatus Latescibacterota bacterium]